MILINFPERLAELLIDNKLTAIDLYGKLGCTDTSVYRYLTGTHLPTVELLVKMADILGCTTDYLLGLEDENYVHPFNECPPFHERLRFLLKNFNISQHKLQKDTGIAESVMRYWLKGKTQPSVYNIVRIAKALDCSVDFVLGR